MKRFVLLVLTVIGCSAHEQLMPAAEEYLADVHRFHESTDAEESDIYWRTWQGKVPRDAIIGGYTERECGTDVPIYIGQVLKTMSGAEIVPVQIFRRSKYVKIFVSGTVTTTKLGIQVMCARDASIVTWVSKNDTVKYNITADQDCVISGAELQQSNTFFGRAEHEDITVIGKILDEKKLMYFEDDNKEVSVNDYEILCFTKAVERKREELLKSEEEKNIRATNIKLQKEEVATKEAPKPVVSSTSNPLRNFHVRWG